MINLNLRLRKGSTRCPAARTLRIAAPTAPRLSLARAQTNTRDTRTRVTANGARREVCRVRGPLVLRRAAPAKSARRATLVLSSQITATRRVRVSIKWVRGRIAACRMQCVAPGGDGSTGVRWVAWSPARASPLIVAGWAAAPDAGARDVALSTGIARLSTCSLGDFRHGTSSWPQC
ncbi:MAG: hypothetical protein KDC33_08470 [Thermoleophilia bacterium]|nr:hypothetical protein [Thermoleophilia bacterium]